jgi:adenosylhomocysteinase
VFAILDLLETAPTGIRARGSAGRRAVVAGFGPVGEGVAQALAAAGLAVTVSEQDPVRALQATFAGYDTAPLIEAVATADLVVSATGVRDTVSVAVLRAAADDLVVAVAGGVDQEVAIDDAVLTRARRETIGPKIERVTIPGEPERRVVLLDGGGCINITAGEGNPIEIMDLSFAVQLEAVRTLLDGAGRLGPGVHPVRREADDLIARAALAARGVQADVRDDAEPDYARRGPRASDPAPLDTRTTRFGPLA